MEKELHIVTGAFGYSGKYIAKRLLEAGHEVRTLTDSPNRPHSFGDRIEARPFDFANVEKLAESLRGAKVLYNTYWVRFNHKTFNHSVAVDNTLALFEAAQAAGVERVVHTSITNPSEDSPLEYFSGKAVLERSLRESDLSHAILRPAVLFGSEDILINNIAWTLRHMPVFGVFGDGNYRLQPIFVDDYAKLCVEKGVLRENEVVDAIGPETFTYRELAQSIGELIGKRRPVVGIPSWLGFIAAWCMGKIVGDVLITREEIKGLMADLLYTDSTPMGATRLTEWIRENRDTLGRSYSSELARRRNRAQAYDAT